MFLYVELLVVRFVAFIFSLRNIFLKGLAFTLLFICTAFASPAITTYQAKIIKPNGYPLESSNVNFKFTILDPAGSCVLYTETYSAVNMLNTAGVISFSLGSGIKTYPVSATSFKDVFSNATPNLGCDVSSPVTDYSPQADDIRKIVMQFNDGSGWQTLPAMAINAVPYAMYAGQAQKLNGFTDSDFVKTSTLATCGASEALRYNGASFSCVAVGSAGAITSSDISTALGFTPAAGASVTALTTSLSSTDAVLSSVSSTVFSVSSTVASLNTTVSSLTNTVAASFAAITSSQWTNVASGISYLGGNVGIGTSEPTDALTVSGGVSLSRSIAIGDGTTNSTVATINAANFAWYGWYLGGVRTAFIQSTASEYSIYSQTSGVPMNFFTSSAERMRISASGSVGIGTTNPTHLLHPNKSTTMGAGFPFAPTDLNNAVVRIQESGAGHSMYLDANTILSDITGPLHIGTYQSQPIRFGTSNTTQMTISNAGNIGMGTTNPTTKLHVVGSNSLTNFTVSNTSGTMVVADMTTPSAIGVGGSLVFAATYHTGGNTMGTGSIGTFKEFAPSNGTDEYNHSLVFKTNRWTEGIIERMRITSKGDVGIGLAAPTAKLHLTSGTTTTAPLKFTSGTLLSSPQSGTIEYDGSQLYFTDGANSRRAIATNSSPGSFDNTNAIANASGNITLSPNNTTGSVIVSATTASTSSETGALIVKGGLGVAGAVNIAGPLSLEDSITVSNAKYIYSKNNSGNAGRVLGMNNANVLYLGDIDNVASSTVFTSNGGNNYLSFSNSLGVRLNVSGSAALSVVPSGNVGVGTTNPSANLHVQGDMFLSPVFYDGNYGKALKIGWHADPDVHHSIQSTISQGAASGNGLRFFVHGGGNADNQVLALQLTGGGNVGVGTSSPVVKLDVAGTIRTASSTLNIPTGSVGLSLVEDGGNSAALKVGGIHIGGSYAGSNPIDGQIVTAATNISLHPNGVQAMTIQQNGNVGVGTTSPIGKLFVGSDWRTTHGGSNLYLQQARPGGSNTNDLGITYSKTSSATTDPLMPGLTLYNDDTTAGGWTPMMVFAKAESGASPFKTATAAIGSRSPLGTGNGDSWIDGELHFYTSGASTQGLTSRMVIDKSGNVGVGTTSPQSKLNLPYAGSGNHNLLIGNTSDLASNNFEIGVALPSGNTHWPLGIAVSGTRVFGVDATGNLKVDATGASYLMGSLGVGTAAPTAILEVKSGSGSLAKISGEGDGYAGGTMLQIKNDSTANSNNYISLQADANGTPINFANFQYGGSNNLVISNSSGGGISLNGGNVGIGTNSPQVKLQVAGNILAAGSNTDINSNPNTTLVGSMSDGYGWQIGSGIGGHAGNGHAWMFGTNGSYLELGYSNSVSAATSLKSLLYYLPSTSSLSLMRVGGNVGIGTTTPTEKLHVVGNLRVQGSTDCTLGNGAGGTNCSSDVRLKENIKPIPYALDKVLSLKGVEFDWNIKSSSFGRHDIGVIAQDVEKVFPTAVINDKDTGYKKVDYAVLVAPVIEALKELYNKFIGHEEEIELLQAKTAQLEEENKNKDEEIKELRLRLERIERKLSSE